MKKRRVSAALHFELTEYASLLRALRTRDAMELTTHLTKPSPFSLPPQNLENNLDDELLDDPKTSKKVTPQQKRDQWTRWPLLLEDVPIPEWTLEDEVAVIASRVMKARPTPAFEGPREHDDPSYTDYVMSTELEEDDPDYPFYVPYLTSTIASFLSMIFSLLAKHTPARPASMQNRIEPLNWRSVVDVIADCDVAEYANPKVVENVIRRMEAIYGPSFEEKTATSYRIVDRINSKKAESDRIHKLLEEPMTSLFSQASPPHYKSPLSTPPPPPPKRRRDQTLSPGERCYKVNPNAKRGRECEMDYNSKSHPAEVVRRSTRARTKVTSKVDDMVEE